MKLTQVITIILLCCGTTFGQTPTVDSLQRTVEAQGREIDELKAQLAQIQQALGLNAKQTPTLQPAVFREPVRQQTTPTIPAPAGFRFTGDFRLRLDAAIRSASPQATGLQTVRGRYRLRFNADRDVAQDLNFHVQLSTGAVNNGITFDQDFAGGVSRHPFLISEGYVDYHPRSNLSIRAGKQEEIFADGSRFLWDDDVRFNGFNERFRHKRLEFRGGQYFFVNPNVFNTPATSPLTLAGVQPGTIARASQMYHQGLTFDAPINSRWKQLLIGDVQIFRNPNLIALTSNATGVTATVNPAIGITVAGTAPGVGNATTSPTSAILYARHYQIARASYRLDGTQIGGHPKLPMTLLVQAARNMGTSQLRDAIMSSISIGRATQKHDVRGLYMFAIKDANSLISQLTDDDLGTAVGVNIATHHLRMDYTIRPNVYFQNLLFLQKERRSSNPAAGFFVPLGRETPMTWRYLGQIAIGF